MKHSWVEIDLNRLKQNICAVQAAVDPQTEIIYVVKADAYGHGLIPLARAAAESGVNWFAVVLPDEAVRLREALPKANLLLLGYADPEDVDVFLKNNIVPIVIDESHGRVLAAAARKKNKTLPVHLKVDTGMGRVGVQWDEVQSVVENLQKAGSLTWAGVCSHLAQVIPGESPSVSSQIERFRTVLKYFPANAFRHLSNSRGAMYFPEWDFDGVRQGIGLYGYEANDAAGRFQTRPILQWKSRVAQVKRVGPGFPVGYDSTYRTDCPTQIATVAVGYCDGYRRALSNRGVVLIGGRRCPVVGRVSMNWITVDVGPNAQVAAGDEVVLLGKQGGESFWANEMADLCGTISYEILTGINATLERRYQAG